MDQEPKISPIGLFTDPSNLDAPEGALLTADDVVIRRRGCIEPRPGFSSASASSTSRAIDFSSSFLQKRASATQWGDDTTLLTEAAANLSWNDYAIFGCEARKNLYMTTSDRLRKVVAPLNSASARAGAPTVHGRYVSRAAGTAVLQDRYVAYRFVTKVRDVNRVEVRSGVSGRVVYGNTALGATADITLRVYLHKGDTYGWVAGSHSIEVYRTLGETTNPPTDELYLSTTVEITAAHITAGYVDITDSTKDEDLGASLYTNDSQEGLAANHVTPPAAKCLALFNGSLYLGDLTYPAQQIFRYPSRRTLAASSTEIGGRLVSIGFTSGSTDCTVADSSLYKVGMIVNNAGTDYTVNTDYIRITSIVNATTLRLSGTWNQTTGSYNRTIMDSIRIGSQYFLATTLATLVGSIRGGAGTGAGESFAAGQPSSLVTATAISDDTSAISDDTLSQREFLLEAFTPGQTPPQVWATHGSLYNPVLPEPTESTGFSLPQETLPNGVAWSNELEPEHFTAVNVDEAGAARGRVMNLAPIGDALLLFKSDGLYRLSGFASSGIRFDEVDKDARLLYPHAMAVLGYKAYAWCDSGVLECGSSGCVPVSAPAIGNRLEPLELAIGAGSTTAHGAWMVANRKASEIILGVPDTADLTVADTLYVFNAAMGGWVNWMAGADTKCGMQHDYDGKIYLFQSGVLRVERPSDTYDQSYQTVTISAVSGLSVTISAGSGWTPEVGDALVKGGITALVTGVTDATHFTVSDALTTGLATAALKGYTSSWTPLGATAKNPGALKVWGECAVVWGSILGMREYDVSVTSSVSSTAVPQTRTLSVARPTTEKSEAYRFAVPRNHGRCSKLYPKISVRQAAGDWRYEGLALSYRYMSTRVRRI